MSGLPLFFHHRRRSSHGDAHCLGHLAYLLIRERLCYIHEVLFVREIVYEAPLRIFSRRQDLFRSGKPTLLRARTVQLDEAS